MLTIIKKHNISILIALVLSSIIFQARAAETPTHFAIEPGSTLSLKGSSTFHDYECTADTVEGTFAGDTSGLAKNLLDSVFIDAKVEVPVKSLSGTSDGITNNMKDALKGKDFPTITFSLTHCGASPDSADTSGQWGMKTEGNLTIAGKTNPIEMNVRFTDLGNGYFRLEGSDELLMTDYGVDPPSFMFGVMKTNPRVTVHFDIKLKAE